jgi:hypothetical protein
MLSYARDIETDRTLLQLLLLLHVFSLDAPRLARRIEMLACSLLEVLELLVEGPNVFTLFDGLR